MYLTLNLTFTLQMAGPMDRIRRLPSPLPRIGIGIGIGIAAAAATAATAATTTTTPSLILAREEPFTSSHHSTV